MSAPGTYIAGAVESGGRQTHRKRRHLKVSYFFFAAIAAVIVTQLDASSLHLYSIGAMGLLAAKMFMALFYRPAKVGREELEYLGQSWVTAVIPIYNEDPVTFEQDCAVSSLRAGFPTRSTSSTTPVPTLRASRWRRRCDASSRPAA